MRKIRIAMLPLLEYSAKKEQMLREYHAQLEPQLEAGEPWVDAHTWVMLTGEVDVLIRETVQLYYDVVRADEFHHYCATTQPQYPYVQTEEHIEHLFRQLRDLFVKGLALATQLEQHGYLPTGQEDLTQCLHAVDILLADESPIYSSEAFQDVLQGSLNDIKEGRVVELTPEQR